MGYTSSSGLPNLDMPDLIPIPLRKNHVKTFRMYDVKWNPMMDPFFPAEVSHSNGELDSFIEPKFSDNAEMARHSTAKDEPDFIARGVDHESFFTKLAKLGYIQRDDEFRKRFIEGLIDQKYKMLNNAVSRGLARLREYDLIQYMLGDTNHMNDFSNQASQAEFGRRLYLTANDSDDATNYKIKGTIWSNTSSALPYQDIRAIRTNILDFGGPKINKMYVGPWTAFYLDMNSDLKDSAKAVRDVTGGVVGASVAGVTIEEVAGQRYKNDVGGSLMIGHPGRGDSAVQTWSNRNEKEMMRTTHDSVVYEFAIFAGDEVFGNSWWSKTTLDHANPKEYFTRVVLKDYPEKEWLIWRQAKWGMRVFDWSNFCILDKTCAGTQ